MTRDTKPAVRDGGLSPALHERLVARAKEAPGLELLVLYGSRAEGKGHPLSDWDLGYLAGASFDPDAFRIEVCRILGTDDVDLVDLDRASGLLRFQAARHGVPLFEHPRGYFLDFAEAAASFWCDVEPVVRAAHAEVLEALDR